MFYIVYKTINLINGKEYIGKHQTRDMNDGYMGSGKLLKYAINKYGIDAFDKRILFIFDNELEMNTKEKELVTEAYCKRTDTYNICPGGHGGFGYILMNNMSGAKTLSNERKKDYAKKISIANKRFVENNPDERKRRKKRLARARQEGKIPPPPRWELGKKHTNETKQKISKANSINQKGKKNSQYGTYWISKKGEQPRKINKQELQKWLDCGWFRGRKGKNDDTII